MIKKLEKLMAWINKKPSYLYGLVFFEAWIFPFPPDPFYFSIILGKKPSAQNKIAFTCTVFSVMGGCVAYGIGYLGTAYALSFIQQYYAIARIESILTLLRYWGGALILLKSVTPLPYKIVAILSGVIHLNFGVFILSSLIARAFRFYVGMILLRRYGPVLSPLIARYKTKLQFIVFLGLVGSFIFLLFHLYRAAH